MTDATTLTWTAYTFRCEDCGHLCYASAEAITEARASYGDEAGTDADVVNGFAFCLGCNGMSCEGEKVAPMPAVGTRVRLVGDEDRYPHFIAPAGAVGTITESDSRDGVLVTLDEPLAGAEEWDNAVQFGRFDSDPREDVEQFVRTFWTRVAAI